MTRYRNIPVIIEAFKFGTDDYPEWFLQAEKNNQIEILSIYSEEKLVDAYAEIKTLEGIMTANTGDYIVRGVEGEIYPVEPSIFARTYEKVDGEGQ